jgi:hypothetical protein
MSDRDEPNNLWKAALPEPRRDHWREVIPDDARSRLTQLRDEMRHACQGSDYDVDGETVWGWADTLDQILKGEAR